ncbi:hypothetical protein MKW94_023805 [Papaver nudicaule]|uniref:Uncharacterized protein n=1 Tax=Papaver nudicaule TaxID=74823 RepID=A0AA41VYP6_PAPNU|nr:hypothetical protein [Papaver nudicaule]MCL7049970.1 hypothetical protein [Papaver nudicaule]
MGWKYCRSLFFRTRATLKKVVVKNEREKKLKFQYDPSSYALNFDDGMRKEADHQIIGSCDEMNSTWVYVLWVKSY